TIVMSISIPISGDEITKTIAETLEIDNEQAEKAKIICGLDKTKAQGIVNNILSDMIKKIIARINEATAFLADSYPDRSHINEILLCGGGANIKNFAQIINEAVKIPAQNANAFINLNRRQNISSFGEEHSLKTKLSKISSEKKLILRQDSSLSYATAIGLALRNIFLN
ncbi:MAG: pilus assembly protein PilM, partial [Patescibacteria group bacterium]|nr:pilus assembly protein PilM [Patescibacteria group bacterium]